MNKLNTLAVTVMAALIAAPAAFADDNAPTVDFHGYMRAGVGHFNHGGSQTRWNSEQVGRLGNEEDTYGELALGSRVFKKDDTEFFVNTRFAMKSKGDNDYEATERSNYYGTKGFDDLDEAYGSEDVEFALREMNVQAKGIIQGKKDATLWAGKRFYNRHDVHLWDYYYEDLSDSGAGLENLELGPGKLSIAWVRKAHDNITKLEDGYSKYHYELTDFSGNFEGKEVNGKYYKKVENSFGNYNMYDIRYGGSYWNGGYLELSASFMDPDKSKHQSYVDTSAGFSGLYTADITFSGSWGFNTTTLQYGTKAVSLQNHPMYYQTWGGDLSHHYWLRVMNQGEVAVGSDKFHIMHAVRYDYDHIGNDTTDNTKMFAVTVRPSYQVTTYSRIMAEVGAFWKKVENAEKGTGADEQGQKYTLAYAIAPSASLWARPEIRFYCSYLHSSNKDSISDNLYDGNSWNNGVNFGVQAEAWW